MTRKRAVREEIEQSLTITWKMKNLLIKDSSKPVFFGIPSKRASRRRMIGKSIMRTARRTGGRIPYKEGRNLQSVNAQNKE